MEEPQGIFSFEAEDINGNVVHLDSFIGKALLIVNTASKGTDKYELRLLQDLYDKYKEKGIEVLAFPCRQFLKREHKNPQKIKKKYIEKCGCTFPIFGLTKVNGENASPIFRWLKRHSKGLHGSAVEWNYTKFFVKDDGTTVLRFSSVEKYEKIRKAIENNLPAQFNQAPNITEKETSNEEITSKKEEQETTEIEEKEVIEVE